MNMEAVVLGGIGFVSGCVLGHIAGASSLLAGGVVAVHLVATHLFEVLFSEAAAKNNWSLFEFLLLKTIVRLTFTTLAVVALFALGVLNPLGAALFLSGTCASIIAPLIVSVINVSLYGNILYSEALVRKEEERFLRISFVA